MHRLRELLGCRHRGWGAITPRWDSGRLPARKATFDLALRLKDGEDFLCNYQSICLFDIKKKYVFIVENLEAVEECTEKEIKVSCCH